MLDTIRGQFVVADHDVVKSFKAQYPALAKNLGSYYIPSKYLWVVGVWVDRDSGQFKELVSFMPNGFHRDHHDTILYNLQPWRMKVSIRAWLEAQVQRANRARDLSLGVAEMRGEKLGRRGGHRAMILT